MLTVYWELSNISWGVSAVRRKRQGIIKVSKKHHVCTEFNLVQQTEPVEWINQLVERHCRPWRHVKSKDSGSQSKNKEQKVTKASRHIVSSSSFLVHQKWSVLYYTVYCCHGAMLARGADLQEPEYVTSVWNNFLSVRAVLHIAWCSVGCKASEAFHTVSFPPWNPWISHITSYCPSRPLGRSSLSVATLWPFGCATVSTSAAAQNSLHCDSLFLSNCEMWAQLRFHFVDILRQKI